MYKNKNRGRFLSCKNNFVKYLFDNKIQTNLQNINKNIDEIDKIKKELITFVPISNEFINNLFN